MTWNIWIFQHFCANRQISYKSELFSKNLSDPVVSEKRSIKCDSFLTKLGIFNIIRAAFYFTKL